MKTKNSFAKFLSLGLACIILAITLAGCGSKEDAYVGKWELVGLESNGEDYSQYLSLLGDFSLELGREGKILSWTFYGQDFMKTEGAANLSWKMDGDKAYLDDGTDTTELILKDGKLSIDFDGSVIIFEKKTGESDAKTETTSK